MKLELAGSNILVKRRAPNIHKESSTIIIPKAHEPGAFDAWLDYDSFECEVLDVGPGEFVTPEVREPMPLCVGDVVIIAQGTEAENQLDDGSFICDISAVWAKVER